MSQIDQLLENFTREINKPWSRNVAGRQRVIFAVYPPAEERRLRLKFAEFEMATSDSGHRWAALDLTETFADWMSKHARKADYFANPEYMTNKRFEKWLAEKVISFLSDASAADGVAVIHGLCGLFGFMHTSTLIEAVEEHIHGRLLVFFPGEHEQNTYRFMNARTGWNYMAVPITCAEDALGL